MSKFTRTIFIFMLVTFKNIVHYWSYFTNVLFIYVESSFSKIVVLCELIIMTQEFTNFNQFVIGLAKTH